MHDAQKISMTNETIRYIRKTHTCPEIESELFSSEVDWLRPFRSSCFFTLPSSFPLNSHPYHKSGYIVGMDAASAAAVWALQIEKGMNCIDICCAPGMKFSLIRDVAESPVVGLDVNEQRLDVCFNLLGKMGYGDLQTKLHMVQLDWELPDKSSCTLFNEVRLRRKKSKRKRQKVIQFENPLEMAYDRVLVDTECSHDGSARHNIKHSEATNFKYEGFSTEGFWTKHSKPGINRARYSTEEDMEGLVNLQKRLLSNGFTLTKPGGLMVYSTCSLQPRQNQEVVDFLIEKFPNASYGCLPFACADDTEDGGLPVVPARRISACSCLFDPADSSTSGQFIAVIRKACSS
jgi:16S rRNA C967 or C1407 C5-methylase (RsmB/RsmF family)